jgi:Arc/MetJ-type ribon-helix-helix transcriptional regulator
MKTISLKLPDEIAARLKLRSRQPGKSKSELTREALVSHLEKRKGKSKASCLDLVHDFVGMAEGPGDLASNTKQMRGYGAGHSQ